MSIFLNAFTLEMDKIKKQGDDTLAQLTESQLHWTPDEESNSIAILIQHIAGNMISRSTDFLTTDGEKASRNRSKEFINQQLTKPQLLKLWEEAWAIFYQAVKDLTEEDLFHPVTVKGKELTATSALMTQLVHYSGHIAQMMYIGKMIRLHDWRTLSIPKK